MCSCFELSVSARQAHLSAARKEVSWPELQFLTFYLSLLLTLITLIILTQPFYPLEQIEAGILLTSPAIDPTAWNLVVFDRGGESKYIEVRLEAILDNQEVTNLLLNKMVVKVVKASGEVLEEATVSSQVCNHI